MTMKKIAKNIKFEEALAEPEQQVQLLESEKLQLEEALAASQIELTPEEISRLEKLGDETGVHTLREWEAEMI